MRYRPPSTVPGGNCPWSIAPEDDSQPLDDDFSPDRDWLPRSDSRRVSPASTGGDSRVSSSSGGTGGRNSTLAESDRAASSTRLARHARKGLPGAPAAQVP